ncbi:MAG: hypothetical protein ABIG95_07175 [Candidatus Woesearchaeota archaeon]
MIYYPTFFEFLNFVSQITAAIISVYVLAIFWYLDSKKIIFSKAFIEYEKAHRYEYFKRAISALSATIVLTFIFNLGLHFQYAKQALDIISIMIDICLLLFAYYVYRSLQFSKGRRELDLLRKHASK